MREALHEFYVKLYTALRAEFSVKPYGTLRDALHKALMEDEDTECRSVIIF